MNTCIFHKWSKWEEFEATITFFPGTLAPPGTPPKEYTAPYQKRSCERCGYIQHERIKDL